MKSIFSPDSKVFRVMNRFADLVILNFLYFVICLPVVTAGAATTAMYTVCFRMDTENEQSIVKPYFKAFRDNFKQATGFWIPVLLFGAASVFDSLLFYHAAAPVHYGFWLFAPAAILTVMLSTILFPLISQFDMPWKVVFKNSVLLLLGRFPAALLLGALQALPFILLYAYPVVFLRIGCLWILGYFAAVAYLGSKVLRKAFAPLYEISTKSE